MTKLRSRLSGGFLVLIGVGVMALVRHNVLSNRMLSVKGAIIGPMAVVLGAWIVIQAPDLSRRIPIWGEDWRSAQPYIHISVFVLGLATGFIYLHLLETGRVP